MLVKAWHNPATAAITPIVKTATLFLRDIQLPLPYLLHAINQSYALQVIDYTVLCSRVVCHVATRMSATVTAKALLHTINSLVIKCLRSMRQLRHTAGAGS